MTEFASKDIKEDSDAYKNFVLFLCGDKSDFKTARKMCKEIRKSRAFHKSRKILSI